tara:strand:+ start:2083 stop:2310 length:228 start_codon:yes stop_codon:yes gene_type:complete
MKHSMDWTYYDFESNKIDTTPDPVGKLFSDYGRERFDGRDHPCLAFAYEKNPSYPHTASEWESFLEESDIRGSVR